MCSPLFVPEDSENARGVPAGFRRGGSELAYFWSIWTRTSSRRDRRDIYTTNSMAETGAKRNVRNREHTRPSASPVAQHWSARLRELTSSRDKSWFVMNRNSVPSSSLQPLSLPPRKYLRFWLLTVGCWPRDLRTCDNLVIGERWCFFFLFFSRVHSFFFFFFFLLLFDVWCSVCSIPCEVRSYLENYGPITFSCAQ